MSASAIWAGVDVGAVRKGFHCCVVNGEVVSSQQRLMTPREVVEYLLHHKPALTAIDSPVTLAPAGERSRRGERELVRAGICHIRYTPDQARLDSNPRYYGWIAHGRGLYAACAEAELDIIECFPTASWTAWFGPRSGSSRTRWSKMALAVQGLNGAKQRMSQDDRDAIGAALTARAHTRGLTRTFGEIVVPFMAGVAHEPITRS